jgi:rhomboid family GlyGly-CTERM serine protease
VDISYQEKEKRVNNFFFALYTLIISFICILFYIFEELKSFFIYDRLAILDGEIWRLFTSNFVHLSFYHLLSNMMAFIFLGYLLEKKNRHAFASILLLVVLFNGIILFLFEENMIYFAGISSVNYAFLFYLGLSFNYASKVWSRTGKIMLILIVLKILLELCNCSIFFSYLEKETFNVMPLSHLVGIVCSTSYYFIFTYHKKLQ